MCSPRKLTAESGSHLPPPAPPTLAIWKGGRKEERRQGPRPEKEQATGPWTLQDVQLLRDHSLLRAQHCQDRGARRGHTATVREHKCEAVRVESRVRDEHCGRHTGTQGRSSREGRRKSDGLRQMDRDEESTKASA